MSKEGEVEKEMKKLDKSIMNYIIFWGIISTALLLLWGFFDLDVVWAVAGITIGADNYLNYRTMRRR